MELLAGSTASWQAVARVRPASCVEGAHAALWASRPDNVIGMMDDAAWERRRLEKEELAAACKAELDDE